MKRILDFLCEKNSAPIKLKQVARHCNVSLREAKRNIEFLEAKNFIKVLKKLDKDVLYIKVITDQEGREIVND